MARSRITRRTALKQAAAATASVLAAPYVRGAHAAGRITAGFWDHWVPDANNAIVKLCKEWSEKNHVEVHIDYITSQGEKDKVTAAAEAQAGVNRCINKPTFRRHISGFPSRRRSGSYPEAFAVRAMMTSLCL